MPSRRGIGTDLPARVRPNEHSPREMLRLKGRRGQRMQGAWAGEGQSGMKKKIESVVSAKGSGLRTCK